MIARIQRTRTARGTLRLPGDKSISHRALLFGALARGTTRVTGLGPGLDVQRSRHAVETLGIQIETTSPDTLLLHSPGLQGWTPGIHAIDAGNSGTTARLLLGMLTGASGITARIDGDDSLRRRPMRRVAEPLRTLGADIRMSDAGTLPLTIEGRPLRGGRFDLPVASAQVKTALLLAGLQASEPVWIREPSASRDHTERLLPMFGIPILRDGAWLGMGPGTPVAADLVVPADPSSAAFFAGLAALIPGAHLDLPSVSTNPGRTGILDVLEQMGAPVELVDEDPSTEPRATWRCRSATSELRGIRIGGALIPRLIDEIPLIAVLATQARGETVITDAGELRVKESDRIEGVAAGLRALGADVETLPDGLRIRGPTPLRGATLDTWGDHRLAMAFAVAGLVAEGTTVIRDAECASVSFPSFWTLLAGAVDAESVSGDA